MNEEGKSGTFALDGHPDEDQLLLALERELPAEDATRVEQHLGSCWSCRARFDEMQRGILAFVEYREKRYLPSLPAPSGDSSGFRGRLRTYMEEVSTPRLHTRIWRKLITLFGLPSQLKWVSAVAMAMVLVIFWVEVLVNPRIVSASELLTRAVAAQNPQASSGKNTPRRIVRQKVQIRSGKQSVVRDFEWNVGSPVRQAEWRMQPDPLSWDSPLTAEGFELWRNSLAQKKEDKVTRSGSLLMLDTATSQSFIKEARIVVRAHDFHPVAQYLRFTDDRQLDLTELSFQILDEPQRTLQPMSQAMAPLKSSRVAPASPLSTPVDLDETELQLRYMLFTHKWDLGEDLVIGRSGGQVTLSGVVSSGERESAMQDTLGKLPNVQLALNRPSGSLTQNPSSSVATTKPEAAVSSLPLLKELLETTFTSREERLAFVDRCLADSDTALSHAWALKRLVERYSEAEERLLNPKSDARLHEMLRAHLQELERANSGLAPLLKLLPASNTGEAAMATNWRDRILSLFAAVQKQDRLVASLIVNSQAVDQSIATVSEQFRSEHQRIVALLNRQFERTGP